MMKKTLSILSLCIALFAALALVGCGGSASSGGSAPKSESKEKAPVAKKTDYIWFKVEMPEGVGVSDSAGKNADRVQLTFPEDENASADRFIPVWKKALTAEESHADQAEKKGDTFQWKDGGSVEYNGRTWLVGTYEDNSGISTMLFTDVEPGSVYVLISNFDQHKKKPRHSSTPSSSPMTWKRQFPRHAKSRFRASRSSNGTPARAYAHPRTCAPLKQRAPNPGRADSTGPPLFWTRAYCHLTAQIRPSEWDTWPTLASRPRVQ